MKKEILFSILKILIFSLVAKLLLAWWIPFTADEAYYWVWTQTPQWSYFDHPPLIAWLLDISKIFHWDNHLVRFPAVVFCHLALIPWILILFENKQISKINSFLWFALLSPLIGFGSFIVTPDLPLIFFWSWATYFALKYFKNQTPSSAFFMGILVGLGFLSKYNMVLFVLGTLIFMAMEKRLDKIFLRHLPIAFLGFAIASIPVLYWNLDNNFISFRFQLRHGFADSDWDFMAIVRYIGGQLVLLTPLIVYFAGIRPKQFNLRFIWTISWTVMGFFLISSLKGNVEMNWPIVAYPGLMLLTVLQEKSKKWILVYSAVWSTLFAVLLLNVAMPFNKNAKTKYNEVFYYQPLIELRQKYTNLYGGNYQIASYLWFYSKLPTYKLKDISRRDHYDFLEESKPVSPVFYVVKEPHVNLPYWAADEYTVTTEQIINEHFELLKLERK